MFVVAWVGGGLVGYVTWVRFVLMAGCWPKWVSVVTLVLLVMGAGGAVAWSLWRRIHRRSDAKPAFLEERGFFEVEVGRVTEQFGNVVHLMSAYESRWNADDPEPFVRGVNSFQLWNDGDRWWVVGVLWEDERSGGEIPKRYLGTHDHSTSADHGMHD